jgi:ribosomal protein S12 methylthiotransferase
VERYGKKLPELLPEVDVFVGRSSYNRIDSVVLETGLFAEKDLSDAAFPRRVFTQPPSTYLKIQEGCDNRCSYCTIPSIRGPLRSRSPEEIAGEFQSLLDNGFREFTIIGQDITSWGRDRGADLKGLLSRLLEAPGDYFIRLLYLHPRGVDDALIELVANDPRVINYFDLPIQHSEDRILNLMKRGYTKEDLDRLFERIRTRIPDAVLRTTVIVGFPGETEEEFGALAEAVKRWRFDNLGAFAYSREEGTPAARLKGHIKKSVKRDRLQRIMEMQNTISRARLKRLIGQRTKVIVEGREGDRMVGRIPLQAPDVDGLAFIRGACAVGEIKEGLVVDSLDYDVIVQVGGENGTDT